jgi:hypothetical protein
MKTNKTKSIETTDNPEMGIHLVVPHGIELNSDKMKVSVKNQQIIIDLGTPTEKVANQATGIKKILNPPPPPKGHKEHLKDILKTLKFTITTSNHPDK